MVSRSWLWLVGGACGWLGEIQAAYGDLQATAYEEIRLWLNLRANRGLACLVLLCDD